MRKIIEPVIHVVIWVGGLILLLKGTNNLGVFSKSEGTLFLPFLIGTLLNVILFYAVSFYLIPRFNKRRRSASLIYQLLGLLLLITIVESLIDYTFFTAKFSTEDEPFGSQLIINLIANLIFLSLAVTYGFTRNWLKNERLKQKLREEKLKAELSFLKAQVNPHFLFNVLNMAFSSATGNGDEVTANIIERLSGLMRYMLYESNSEQVEIEKEIRYIEDYISLQKQRLSKDTPVKIEFSASGDLAKNTIAPLILVPFVENGFKHGIKLDTKSYINISLEIKNHDLNFRAENSNFNNGKRPKSKDSGIGLENVKKRLLILYPNRHNLEIYETDDKFVVDLKMILQ